MRARSSGVIALWTALGTGIGCQAADLTRDPITERLPLPFVVPRPAAAAETNHAVELAGAASAVRAVDAIARQRRDLSAPIGEGNLSLERQVAQGVGLERGGLNAGFNAVSQDCKASASPEPSKLSAVALAHPALASMQGLVDELGTHPWTRETWDPFGFVDHGPSGRIYLTEDGKGNVMPQPKGHTGLNCLGAVVEALRSAYEPKLSIDDIEPCLRAPRPRRCAAASTGARVIKYSKNVLSMGHEIGRVVRQDVVPGGTIRAVPNFPSIGLCVVSHASAVHKGRRYFHHMIITTKMESGLFVLFDATAANGLRLAEVSEQKLRAYLRDDLAHNAKLGFAKSTARLSCLPIGRPL